MPTLADNRACPPEELRPAATRLANPARLLADELLSPPTSRDAPRARTLLDIFNATPLAVVSPRRSIADAAPSLTAAPTQLGRGGRPLARSASAPAIGSRSKSRAGLRSCTSRSSEC